jgi:NAD(P)H-flavin reductase
MHPPAAWIHSSACVSGAAVAVRVGGKFTLMPAFSEHACATLSGERPGHEAVPHILLIAGGVGINPLYSMLLHLAATGGCLFPIDAHACSGSSSASASLQPHVTLLWSIRALQDAFLLPQLRALASSVNRSDSPLAGRLRIILTLTRQHAVAGDVIGDGRPDSLEPVLLSGRISPRLLQGLLQTTAEDDSKLSLSNFSEHLHAQHALPVIASSATRVPGSQHAFVCGPPSMTECVVVAFVLNCAFSLICLHQAHAGDA